MRELAFLGDNCCLSDNLCTSYFAPFR